MKKIFLTTTLLFSITLLYSQNYFRLTTSPLQSKQNISHLGALAIGSTTANGLFSVYGNNNPAMTLLNDFGQLQIAMSSCNGCFHQKATPGTAVFRALGQSHNLIFAMPNNNNDGTTNIRIADNYNLNSFIVFNNGKVTIGTEHYDTENYKLYVKDGIKTEKIKVEFANVNGWADYVFNKNYSLMPLNRLETFINNNKHLPEVPKAIDVVRDGVELKKMNVLLLKKVEELTLYLIELKKEINKKDAKIINLERKMDKVYEILKIKS